MHKKAIVMKVKKDHAVAMLDDSRMVRIIKKEGIEKGQRIYLVDEDIIRQPSEGIRDGSRMNWKALSGVLAACLMLIAFMTYNGMDQVHALVSMDINPSVEFKLDKEDKVLEVVGLNDDALLVIDEDMIGLDITEVISLVVNNAEAHDFLNDDHNTVLIAAATVENEYIHELSMKIEAHIKDDEHLSEDLNVIYLEASNETAEASMDTEASLGKVQVEQIIKAAKSSDKDDDNDVEDDDDDDRFHDMTLKEIVENDDYLNIIVEAGYKSEHRDDEDDFDSEDEEKYKDRDENNDTDDEDDEPDLEDDDDVDEEDDRDSDSDSDDDDDDDDDEGQVDAITSPSQTQEEIHGENKGDSSDVVDAVTSATQGQTGQSDDDDDEEDDGVENEKDDSDDGIDDEEYELDTDDDDRWDDSEHEDDDEEDMDEMEAEEDDDHEDIDELQTEEDDDDEVDAITSSTITSSEMYDELED